MLIIIVIAGYLALEIAIWARFPDVRNTLNQVLFLWAPAAAPILLAVGV